MHKLHHHRSKANFGWEKSVQEVEKDNYLNIFDIFYPKLSLLLPSGNEQHEVLLFGSIWKAIFQACQ